MNNISNMGKLLISILQENNTMHFGLCFFSIEALMFPATERLSLKGAILNILSKLNLEVRNTTWLFKNNCSKILVTYPYFKSTVRVF